MSYNKVNFYHVTNHDTYIKIMQSGGIDPALSKGKFRVCWYVKQDMVAWAIAHVIYRHKWKLEALVVCKVKASEDSFSPWGKGYMFVTRRHYQVVGVEAASTYLVRDELRQAQLTREIMGSNWYEHLKGKDG